VERNLSERPLRVLVVDDCEDTTASLAWLIRAWGFVAEEANSGPDALRLAAASPPDVALLDLMMPRMDGWAVARELRRTAGGEARRLVILSGCNGYDIAPSSAHEGYHLHLRKPIDLDELRRFLTRSEKEICRHVPETTGESADEHGDRCRRGGCHR
jgi:CheY-like chemotaxis protein